MKTLKISTKWALHVTSQTLASMADSEFLVTAEARNADPGNGNPGLPPQPGDVLPAAGDVAPAAGDVAPAAGDGARPRETAPRPRETAPRPRETAPRPRGTAPRPRGTAPRPRGTAPRPRGTAPRPRGTAPRPRGDGAPAVGDGAPARRPNVRAGIQQRRVYYRRMREMAEETLRARWELEEILKQIEEEERRHC